MSLGEAAQAVAAFEMVQTALNWLVDNYPGLAEWRWTNSIATASCAKNILQWGYWRHQNDPH